MKKTPSTIAAWEQDSFWKEVVTVITGGKKLRGDHYLQGLSGEQLEQLRSALSAPGNLADQQKLCPARCGGKTDGELPPISLLSDLSSPVRQVIASRQLVADDAIANRAKERCQELGLDQRVTNAVLRTVGEEALRQRAQNLVGPFAISAANVLLMAEGMRTKGKLEEVKVGLRKEKLKLDERHIAMLEKKAAQADSAKGILGNKELTEDQKRQRMLELFGM